MDPAVTMLEQIGAFAAEARVSPPELREKLALHMVDTVGAWIASRRTTEGAALLAWRRTLREGIPRETVASLRLDVATHCALARLSEIDDIHLASTTTPGAIVVPAALPGDDPDALAGAILAGYEVIIRIGEAIDGAASLQRGIWPTYF